MRLSIIDTRAIGITVEVDDQLEMFIHEQKLKNFILQNRLNVIEFSSHVEHLGTQTDHETKLTYDEILEEPEILKDILKQYIKPLLMAA